MHTHIMYAHVRICVYFVHTLDMTYVHYNCSQAEAIKDSVLRIKLDITIHAPVISIPYKIRRGTGSIVLDLGMLQLTNRFINGGVLMERTEMAQSSLLRDYTVFDQMDIKCTALQVRCT